MPKQCRTCGQRNSDGSKFCGGCGASLLAATPICCAKCGHANESWFKFCADCGSPVAWSGAAPTCDTRPHGDGSYRGLTLTDYRCPGEPLALACSIGILLSLIVASAAMTVGTIIVVFVLGLVYIKVRQSQLLGNSVLATPGSYSAVFLAVQTACKRLHVDPSPRAHIIQEPSLNAFAIGSSAPFSVVLHSAVIQSMDRDELAFIVGHEVGHVKAGHTFWLSLVAPLGSEHSRL